MPLYFIVRVPVIDDSYLVGNSYINTLLAVSDGGVGSSLRIKVAPEGNVFQGRIFVNHIILRRIRIWPVPILADFVCKICKKN